MERQWLLLFKENVFLLTGQVQRILFEQYMNAVADTEELRSLEDRAASKLAGDVFLRAANHPRHFKALSGEQIALRLRELIKQHSHQKPGLTAVQAGEAALPAEAPADAAWAYTYKRICYRNRRRRIAARFGAVGFMAVAIILGGFLFGMVAPSISPTGLHASASAGLIPPKASASLEPAVEGTVVEGADNMSELSVQEQEAKRYADFKIQVPSYLPPGYAYNEGSVWLRKGQPKSDHAMLVYTNRQDDLLRVSYYKLHKNGVLTTGSFSPETRKETVVRGIKALFATTESNTSRLDWMEDDIFISIFGRGLDETELVKMAESMK